MAGGQRRTSISQRAFNTRYTEGPDYNTRRKERVVCLLCGAEVGRPSLKRHQLSQRCIRLRSTYVPPTPVRIRHRVEQERTPVEAEANRYELSIPRDCQDQVGCPVDGCEWRTGPSSDARSLMRRHFRWRHWKDTVVILEEGELPRCTRCGFFSIVANTEAHWTSRECQRLTARREAEFQRSRQEAAQAAELFVDGQAIHRVTQFKYLGRLLDEGDDDSPAAMRQLARASETWRRFNAVLSRQGASARTRGYFYKAVVQAILLYGSESWTLPESTLRNLRSFHSRVARYLTARHIRRLEDGTWFCPPTAEVLEEAGLRTIDEYIQKRRDTIRSGVVARPIYWECRRSATLPGQSRKVVWWRLT